jgi:hypothetical protein
VREEGRKTPGKAGVSITLSAGELRQNLELSILPAARVSGRVFGLRGEPLHGAIVTPYREAYDNVGMTTTLTFPSANSNDQGEFVLSSLDPGDYFFRMDPPKLNLDETGPPYYGILYPGTTDSVKAIAVRVLSGISTRLDNVTIPSVRGGSVALHVINQSGLEPTTAFIVNVRRKPDTRSIRTGQIPRGLSTTRVGPLPAGSYVIRAEFVADGYIIHAEDSIDISEGDIDKELNLVIQKPGQILARVTPPSKIILQFFVPSVDATSHYTRSSDSSGLLTYFGMNDGHYRVGAATAPDGMYIETIREGDSDVLKDGIDVHSGRDSEVNITLDGPASIVHGTVRNSGGSPASGAIVTLLPDDRPQQRKYVTATADRNGEFRLQASPGSYHLFAWLEMEGAAYRNSEFMRQYDGEGMAVILEKGSNMAINLAILP